MRRDERGSGTLIMLAVAMLLLSVGLVAVLWAAVSTAQHRAAAAADLVALSAAQAVRAGDDPCAAARRIAALQAAELSDCRLEGEVVSVVTGVRAELGSLGRPLVTVAARAGPVGQPSGDEPSAGATGGRQHGQDLVEQRVDRRGDSYAGAEPGDRAVPGVELGRTTGQQVALQ